jgi:ribosomal protein L19E
MMCTARRNSCVTRADVERLMQQGVCALCAVTGDFGCRMMCTARRNVCVTRADVEQLMQQDVCALCSVAGEQL